MVLLSLGLINNMSPKIDTFQNEKNILQKNSKYIAPFTIGWVSAILVCLNAIPAILVAINCNKEKPILYGIFALIFSDLYLIQWAVRKFIFKEKNYCKLA